MKPPFPNADDIFSLLGFAVVHAQTVERMMRFCTTYILQRGGPLTFEKLQSINEAERTKTLGYFLDQIRRRSKLHPELADSLRTYLDMRNDIVHDHSRIDGWNLETIEGAEVSKAYLWSFVQRGDHLLQIFAALTKDWEIQAGYTVPLGPEIESYVAENYDKYQHLIPALFKYSDSVD